MKNRKKPIGIIIAISIVLLLTIVTLLGWAYYNSKLDLIQYDDGSKEIDTSTSYAIDNDELDIADLPDAPEDVDASGGIEILEGDIYHDDDVINILSVSYTHLFSTPCRVSGLPALAALSGRCAAL